MAKKLFAGKKGIVDDLFDMLFVIVVIFFGLFFMYFVLAANAGAREAASVSTVNGPEYQDTLIDMLKMQYDVQGTSYSGSEFVLLTAYSGYDELFYDEVSDYMNKGGVKGTFVVYFGDELDDSNVFSTARSDDFGSLVREPATVTLKDPETAQVYLIAFYGEKK